MTDLPPFQPLPDHVRDKARQQLHEGMERKPPVWRGPVGIAAAVITLAAGAAVASQALWAPGSTPLATPPSSGPPQFEGYDVREVFQVDKDIAPPGAAERCAAAKPANPPVAEWKPLVTTHSDGNTLIAFTTPAGRIFCALTATTVTVSDPINRGPDGVPARVLFAAPSGAMAGIVQPGVRHLSVLNKLAGDRGTSIMSGNQAAVIDSLFLLPNGFAKPDGDTSFLIDGSEVPAADRPAVTPAVTDRPRPPADRTSEAGQQIKACLEKTSFGVPDPDQFQPGAYSRLGEHGEVRLGRFEDLLLICRFNDHPSAMVQDQKGAGEGWRNNTITGVWNYYDFTTDAQGASTSDKKAVLGRVLDQRVASITASAPGMAEQSAVIANGTYVLPGPLPNDVAVQVIVKDADGKVLEEISLRE